AQAVGEVAERAAGDQSDRDPDPRHGRVAGQQESDEGEREDGEGDQRQDAAPGQPEGDALVVGEGEVQRTEQVDLLAGHQLTLDDGLERLVEDQDGPAERPSRQPGALLRGAHPRIRPTTTASTTKRTISATTGAKL